MGWFVLNLSNLMMECINIYIIWKPENLLIVVFSRFSDTLYGFMVVEKFIKV